MSKTKKTKNKNKLALLIFILVEILAQYKFKLKSKDALLLPKNHKKLQNPLIRFIMHYKYCLNTNHNHYWHNYHSHVKLLHDIHVYVYLLTVHSKFTLILLSLSQLKELILKSFPSSNSSPNHHHH